MNGVGKIDRGSAPRERDQIALRRKGKHLILEHLELGVLKEFFRARGVVENVQEFAQPTILRSLGLRGALLVRPMGSDAQFGHLVHLAGTNLHFDPLLLGTDHAGV